MHDSGSLPASTAGEPEWPLPVRHATMYLDAPYTYTGASGCIVYMWGVQVLIPPPLTRGVFDSREAGHPYELRQLRGDARTRPSL
jgi:hypothetical protein